MCSPESLACQEVPPCRVARLSARRHLHCTDSGRRTHRSAVCARSVRVGQLRKLRWTQALLRTHTQPGPGSVFLRGSSRRLPPSVLPSRPPPEWKWLLIWKICQPFQPIPHFFSPVPIPSRLKLMRVVGTSGATSQRPVVARARGFVCVKPERRSFTHSKSYDLLLSFRFFPEPFGELKTTQCGGRTDTANRLIENHL
jgi:hypothetical protein